MPFQRLTKKDTPRNFSVFTALPFVGMVLLVSAALARPQPGLLALLARPSLVPRVGVEVVRELVVLELRRDLRPQGPRPARLLLALPLLRDLTERDTGVLLDEALQCHREAEVRPQVRDEEGPHLLRAAEARRGLRVHGELAPLETGGWPAGGGRGQPLPGAQEVLDAIRDLPLTTNGGEIILAAELQQLHLQPVEVPEVLRAGADRQRAPHISFSSLHVGSPCRRLTARDPRARRGAP